MVPNIGMDKYNYSPIFYCDRLIAIFVGIAILYDDGELMVHFCKC